MHKEYTWEIDKDTEFWGNSVFSTIKECIEDAYKSGIKPGEKIAIGIAEKWVPNIDAYDVLERLGEYAQEDVGEIGSEWPSFDYRKKEFEHQEKLQEKLDTALSEWLRETDQYPDFYKIYPLAEEITVPRSGNVYDVVIRDSRGSCPKCNGLLIKKGATTFQCADCKETYKAMNKGYAEASVILVEV